MTHGIVVKTFLVIICLILTGPASANSFEETINLLDTKKFDSKNQVIGTLVTQADARSIKLF